VPLSGTESGVIAYGEQRGCALADYDEDGRVDVVLCQTGAETKLYHNKEARPGLIVQLRGPESNPQAIGAVLRLGNGKQWGPAREIHSGAGLFSQNSPRQVLSGSDATKLFVRWPGDKTMVYDVPDGAHHVQATHNESKLRVIR